MSITTATNLSVSNSLTVSKNSILGTDETSTLIVNSTPIFNNGITIIDDIVHESGNFYGTSGTTYFNGDIIINTGTFTTSTLKTTINSISSEIYGTVSIIDNKKLYLTNIDYSNFLSLNHNGSDAYLDFTGNLYIRNNAGTQEIISINSDNTTTFNNTIIFNNSINKFNSNIIMTDEHYILFTNDAANNYLQIYNNITNSYAKYYHTYAHFFSVTTNIQVLKLTESLINLYRNSLFHKDVTISGNLSISGNISSNLSISGKLDVSGNTTISGDLDIYKNMTISGTLVINDLTTFKNDILIEDNNNLYFGDSISDIRLRIYYNSVNDIIFINNYKKVEVYNYKDYIFYHTPFTSAFSFEKCYTISSIYNLFPTFTFNYGLDVTLSGTIVVSPVTFNGGVYCKKKILIDSTEDSTSKTTGALVLRYGGLGVQGDIYCSGINASSNITTTSNVTSNVLNSTDIFASNYINETMYKKFRGYSQYINNNPSFTYSYVKYDGTTGTSSSESLTIPDSCRCVKLFYEIDINEAISTQSMTASQYIYKRRMYSNATIWTQYLAYSVIDQSGFSLQCVITSNNILTIQFPKTTNLNDNQLFYWSYTIEIL